MLTMKFELKTSNNKQEIEKRKRKKKEEAYSKNE
jgi:hypothetical protein